MAYLLGIDVSTTGLKALIINEQGCVISSVTTEYPLSTPRPLWSEQNPADWWQGTCASIQAALKKANLSGGDISAVGLTGQMHGLVLLDKYGEVLRPAILWNDQRTGEQCTEITKKLVAFRAFWN
jgi:xylulokinase